MSEESIKIGKWMSVMFLNPLAKPLFSKGRSEAILRLEMTVKDF